eukprot:3982447-Pleurochrysis_carterae.AAC.1
MDYAQYSVRHFSIMRNFSVVPQIVSGRRVSEASLQRTLLKPCVPGPASSQAHTTTQQKCVEATIFPSS